MPRRARVVAPGAAHHLTQRGNNRQPVFLADADRQTYLRLLAEHASVCGLRLLGYCLMPNHVHLVAMPEQPDSLARALRRVHAAYAQQFNRRHGRSGHLWQNRYFSCVLGSAHLLAALAYVDLNPVRAGMVGAAVDYQWSSARAHVAGCGGDLLDWATLAQVRGFNEWNERLAAGLDGRWEARLRRTTHVGGVLKS